VTKISKRLKAIADFVSSTDTIVDVGCDHGLLSIYLFLEKSVRKVIASDIRQTALQNAINNIKQRNLKIETVLSDGIQDVNLKGINTLILSGMGTSTILHILDNAEKIKEIKKLVIQSNNDYSLLRQSLNHMGYYLEEETYTYDKKKWYVTCKFIKSDKKNTHVEIQYGFLTNIEYNQYLVHTMKRIVKRIPITSFRSKLVAVNKLRQIKKAISKAKK